LPQKDKERAIYGLKEKTIAKAYIKMIPLGSKDPDAIRLLDWKRPSGPDVSYLLDRSDLLIDFS
jgi:DNA ligase-4